MDLKAGIGAEVTHRLVKQLVSLLNRIFKRNSYRVLAFILVKRLHIVHVLTLNSIHFAASLLYYFGYALRSVILGSLFVHFRLFKVVFEVSYSNGAVRPYDSLNQLLILKIYSLRFNFLSQVVK